MDDDGKNMPEAENVVPFVNAADRLIKHAENVVDQIKTAIAGGDPTYLLHEITLDHFIKITALSKDVEYSHQEHFKDCVKNFLDAIKGCQWEGQFNSTAKARKNELTALAKAKAIEERGKIKRYKYEECKSGEYVAYDQKTNLVLPTFVNAQLVFRDLGIVGKFNQFTEKKTFQKDGKDLAIGELRNIVWDFTYVDFPEKVLLAAIDAYCLRNSFHPIKEYFEEIRSLPTDKHLIDNWLTVTLGAEDNALNREIGKKMLVAIVTRIYKPGSKFDQMIVFESLQGVGKSTLLEVLCGTEYFNSGKILQMESKEQMEALKGRMIYESAELVGHGRADVDAVKAFLSATADRGRWAYATEVRDHPRTAIIVGTTNKNNYLLDETGNRRIWPVSCCVLPTETIYDGVHCPKEANIAWLKENRDLLFREALQLYEDGYSLVMARSLWADIAEIQYERMTDIPLTDNVMEIFAFTEHEGLFIKETSEKLDLRIFSKDIIDILFPSMSANAQVGRQVKSAMQNIIVHKKYKWEYKKVIKIAGVAGSGYIMEIEDRIAIREVKEMIDARRKWRARKNVNGASPM